MEKECNVGGIKLRFDDIVDIHECRKKTNKIEEFTKRKINERNLQYASDKILTAEEEIENDSEEEKQEGSPPLADEVKNEDND